MLPIEQVYPECNKYEYFLSPSSYDPLLKSIGEVVLQVDERDYQGDSWVLYKRGNEYGYLCFGWGSCSGCDSLQACTSYQKIDELRTHLADQIQWKPKEEMLTFLREHDWASDYHGGKAEAGEFRSEATQLLLRF